MEFSISEEAFSRLEASLAGGADASHLPALVELAWHLRQRDTARAVLLAQQAKGFLATRTLAPEMQQKLIGRLNLVEAEAHWLFSRLDEALALANTALDDCSACADLLGCADAHWLVACVMVDRGDPAARDAALELAGGAARRAADTLRSGIADAALARWSALTNLSVAQQHWSKQFPPECADDPALHPALAVWVHDFLGMLAFQTSDMGLSTKHRIHMFHAANATGQVQRAIVAATNVGACLGNLNDEFGALQWMQTGLELARKTQWPGSLGMALMQTASILRNLRRNAEAQDLLLEGLGTLRNMQNSRTYVITLNYLGDVVLDQTKYAQALEHFQDAESRAARLGQRDQQTIALRGQAHAMLHLEQVEPALQAAAASLQAAQEEGDSRNQMEALMVLADLYTRHPLLAPAYPGAPSSALPYLLQADALTAQYPGHVSPSALYETMARAHAQAGDTAQAFTSAMQAIAVREKSQSEAATNRAIALHISHQTERTRAQAEHHRALAEAEAKRAETLQQTGEVLERLSLIGREITAHLDAKAVFQTLDRHVHSMLDATHFSVFLLDADGIGLDSVFGIEHGKPIPPWRVLLNSPTANIALCGRERREILKNWSQDAPATAIPGTVLQACGLFAPLVIGDRLLGVMTIQSPKPDAYGERDLLIFRTLCAYSAIALDNASTYRQLEATLKTLRDTQSELVEKNLELERAYHEQEQASLTDPLTGLRNRRYLLQNIDSDVAITQRRNQVRLATGLGSVPPDTDMAFFMIDVDHFKMVNDQHGHAAGDAVLSQMRLCLQQAARETDYIIRWGGEEFLVVARSTNRVDAHLIAERIRFAVANHAFEIAPGVMLKKTCSVGFACFPFVPEHSKALTWSQVVEMADNGLYRAKQGGRNAWCGLLAGVHAQADGLFERFTRDAESALRSGEIVLTCSEPQLR